MVDFSMNPETAIHQPRIDVNGSEEVSFDTRLTSKVAEELSRDLDTLVPKTHGVFPSLLAALESFSITYSQAYALVLLSRTLPSQQGSLKCL